MTPDAHDSLVVAALRAVDPDDVGRFRVLLDALWTRLGCADLDTVYRHLAVEAVCARAVEDPLWRVWSSAAEAARLHSLTLELDFVL